MSLKQELEEHLEQMTAIILPACSRLLTRHLGMDARRDALQAQIEKLVPQGCEVDYILWNNGTTGFTIKRGEEDCALCLEEGVLVVHEKEGRWGPYPRLAHSGYGPAFGDSPDPLDIIL